VSTEWRDCLLGDVLTLQRGFDLPGRERVDGDVPIISSSGTTGFHNVHKVTAPGVVTGRYGTLGEVHYVTKDFWPLNTTLYVKEFKGTIPLFVAYLLRTLNLSSQNAAGAVPGVNRNHLHMLTVRVPPLHIQRKIAGVLSAYDDLIENVTRRIAILEEMAQSLYREWFVEYRFPGHERVRFVDSPLGKIPAGWKVIPLKEITCKIGSGATPRGGKEAYKQSGISLIRSLNIYDDVFEEADLAFIDDKQAADLDGVRVQEHDILLNITGASVARCCMVPSYVLPARVNQHVAIVRVDPHKADPYFVVSAINSDRYKRQLLALAQGGATREALTKETISNFEVVLPPKDVYVRYGEFVSCLFHNREKLHKKCKVLRHTRDLLLPKLMGGQVDVEDLDIDTGETLTKVDA
jgi:type I restriction enzyme S subunit